MKKYLSIVLAVNLPLSASLLLAQGQPRAAFEGKVMQLRHPAGVSAVAFSPDGKMLACGGADKTIYLWTVGGTEPEKTLPGHENEVLSLAFSPDGKSLASGSLDHRVRIFDVRSGKAVHTLAGHAGGVYVVVFSPDGKLLASGSADRTFRLWDPPSGKALASATSGLVIGFPGSTDSQGRRFRHVGNKRPDGTWDKVLVRGCGSLAFSPDGKVLAAAIDTSWDVLKCNVGQWNTGQAFHGGMRVIRSVAYSPDGKVFAKAHLLSNRVDTKSPETGKALLRLEFPKPHVRNLRFSRDSRTLAVLAGWQKDSTVYFVDVASGKLSRTFDCLKKHVTSIDLSPNGQFLAAASDDGTVLVWYLRQENVGSGET